VLPPAQGGVRGGASNDKWGTAGAIAAACAQRCGCECIATWDTAWAG